MADLETIAAEPHYHVWTLYEVAMPWPAFGGGRETMRTMAYIPERTPYAVRSTACDSYPVSTPDLNTARKAGQSCYATAARVARFTANRRRPDEGKGNAGWIAANRRVNKTLRRAMELTHEF